MDKGPTPRPPTDVPATELRPTVDRPTIASPLTGRDAGDGGELRIFAANDRYEAIGTLGEGGMGEVRLCTDRQIGRSVAMKVMRAEFRDDPDARRRFVREARVQGRTEHPAIVPVHDVGVDESGAPFFTMMRVGGQTLASILDGLRDGATADRFAREYTRHKLLTAFASACLAVDFAHTRGVIHCDLKPANLMLGAFGEVYVLDWGMAALAADPPARPPSGAALRTRPSGGTPGYMAPEQAQGDVPDARSDVYALGAILYEILTLTPMHAGDTEHSRLAQTLDGRVERPSVRAPDRDVPPELEAICMQATARSRAPRYARARELYEDLERYLEGDRDQRARRAMSAASATRAAALAEKLRDAGPEAHGLRSEAMRTVGRALALDPDNAEALRVMVELLTQRPREMPPAAREEMNAAERELDRSRGRSSVIGLIAVTIVLVAAALVSGIHDARAFVVGVLAWLVAAGLGLVRVFRPRADGYAPTYLLVAVTAAVAAMGACYNPALVTPVVALPFGIGFTLSMAPQRRYLPMLAMAVALAVPVVLEALHVLAPSSSFRQGEWCVVPRMMEDLPTAYPALAVHVASVALACSYAVRFRSVLVEMQQRVFFTAWQLRQLAPVSSLRNEPAP